MKEQKTIMDKRWFWPVIYTVIALLIVAFILLYNMLVNKSEETINLTNDQVVVEDEQIETSTKQQTMRYPFDEMYVDHAVVVQDFYDATADAADQQDALFVFKNTFTASNGISISVDKEPFQVLAAMDGVVQTIDVDAFTGNTITVEHSNGYVTKYSSVSDVVVEEGDKVLQGNPLGTAVSNEANPEAGVHLHFQVLQNGTYINPRTILAF